MITIEFNNGNTMKLDPSKYYAYTEKGWLRVRESKDSISGNMKYLIPMTSIFSVSFD